MPIIIPVGGSGGAKLDITAYSAVGSLPASEDAGALAVITSTALGDVYVSADQPASPSSGDVWVWIGGDSLAPIALTDVFTIHPRAVYQYSGSAWILRESYVYTSNSWIEVSLYLYKDGSFLLASSISSVFVERSGSYTLYSTNIYFNAYDGDANSQIVAGFDTAMDLTDVSSITMYLDHTVCSTTNCGIQLAVSANKSKEFVASATSNTVGSGKTLTLDVSSLSGLYYVMIRCYTNTGSITSRGYVHNVRLVK